MEPHKNSKIIEDETRPGIDELRGVIYIFSDGSQYKMLDVKNYIDNLKSSGTFVATRSYLRMKPVAWEKIKSN